LRERPNVLIFVVEVIINVFFKNLKIRQILNKVGFSKPHQRREDDA
jgi:hypothetical protein